MIDRDRELLGRLALVNRHMGDVVLELMADQHRGVLPAEGLRNLGKHLVRVGADLLDRAVELDAVVIED
jgi:hypothetical protein